MKILLLSWRDIKHPWAGGSEVYLHEIAKVLVKDNHQVTMFCPKHPGGSIPFETIDGVNIIRAGNMLSVYIWFWWYYLTKFKGQFDVIVDQNNGIPFFTPALISSIPVVNLTHHIHRDQWFKQIRWPLNYVGYYLEKYAVGLAYKYTKFVVVSQSTKQDVMKYWRIDENNIEVIHNAVSAGIKKTISKSKNPSLIYVGRLKKYKQIDVIIKSMLRLKHDYPDLNLHIVGSGDQMEYLKDLADRMGLARSVIFHGFVSEKLKSDLLSQAWVFVTASSHEGWGISVIEANACGTLAVGSRIDGLKDAICDQKTGLLFESGSIYDLSTNLRKVLKSPALRYEMEKEAVKWARKFSWEKSAANFEKLLERLINQREKMSNFKPLATKILKKKILPLVSVVVPTKNVAKYVMPTFESVIKQTYPKIELIVVDNFSTDDTRKIARKYTKQVFRKGPERNQQRNLAVKKAKGKYLLFLDSDMEMEEELVADCVYNLEKYPKAAGAVLPEIQIGKTIWSKARALEKSFYMGDTTMESPRFFRKTAYLKSGGYDEKLLYAEDMELKERILKLGQIKRSKFNVYHNEDRLSFWQIVSKKYRYGKTAKYYFAKSSENNLANEKKIKDNVEERVGFWTNPWVYLTSRNKTNRGIAVNSTRFIRPVFVTKWQKWLEDPLTSLALICLRFTELSAMGVGYLISLSQKQVSHPHRQRSVAGEANPKLKS